MSSVFDGYERQYCELSANLGKILADLPGTGEEEYKAKLREVDAGLAEADSLTKRMDLEARSLPPAQKASLLAKIRELKSDLTALKRDFKACPPTPQPPGSEGGHASADRVELLQGGGFDSSSRGAAAASDYGVHDRGGGAKMMSATARMEQSSERLQQSRRVLVETEDLGVSILEDLHNQRQTLLHARETLYGVDDSIAKARQILSNMARHATRHKWITAGIFLVLLIAIILVIYLKMKGHS